KTTERGPAARQAGKMDEVQVGLREPAQVRGGEIDMKLFLQCDERVETEDGVVEIARACAILEAAIRIEAAAQKGGDQIPRLTQLLGRQPGDLQHFEPQTHCTST